MLKRSIALAGSVALLGGVTGQVAQADTRKAAAISAVQVEWADAEHTNIKITWTETTPVANTLSLGTSGSPVTTEFGVSPVGADNEFIIDSASLLDSAGHSSTADPAAKSWIVVAADGETSARSADFDRFLYQPSGVTVSFTADNQISWSIPASPNSVQDDPLDVPSQLRYLVIRRLDPDPASAGSACQNEDVATTSTTTGVVAPNGQPYELSVNPDNEWGARLGPVANVRLATSATISAPASSPYGGNTTITGQVTGRSLQISGPPSDPICDEATIGVPNQSVVLQQRTSSTAAWTVVGTTKTDATGKYTAVVKNPGHREYRVVPANTGGVGAAAHGAAPTASRAVRAITRVVSAKFIQPVITYGTKPQAYLWVDPAGTQQAALQFKNASGVWQGVMYKTLYAGRGIATYSWNRRGATQFRWWVPATPTADATYSGIFTLTVR
ncbi:hypothetical protein EV643_102415 [Kribbella sp. VKM Ac-2527]|uniref:Uncharacterized protein n=1 Tax=Kribbella caucasensis TaxID=2512215 RepID=A0A4R6KNJ8_9ACTN|nr:hypothetical protein [Kribbella sp. VKM Ac-2527]TDO52576.1 hypothetical protein EV643_102415 [Kribbella sp. VKM Ac-2527]